MTKRPTLAAACVAALLLSVLEGPASQAQWREDGKVVPDTPWSKSDGDFGATFVFTDKPDDLFEAWEQPSPGVHLSETSTAVRGVPIVGIIYFTGCATNADGNCDLVAQFSVKTPGGKPWSKPIDAELWVGKPPPGKGFLQLSLGNLGVVIDPGDPLGIYKARAEITDRFSKKQMVLEREFTAVEASAKSAIGTPVEGPAKGGPPVAPASSEANAAAREAARTAFSSPEALRKMTIAGDPLSIGPRLWAATTKARKPFAKDTKDVYAVIAIPEIISKWHLSPMNLNGVTDPTLLSILTEASKGGTPVLAGAILKRGNAILPALVLDQLEPADFPLFPREATEAEVNYYYAVIPYEMSEPLFVVEGGGRTFLCHFQEGKLFYFELL